MLKLFPHSPSSECLAELEFSGPFAKGEAYLDSNHCPDLRDSVMLWSIWIFESFTSIICPNFYHIYADYTDYEQYGDCFFHAQVTLLVQLDQSAKKSKSQMSVFVLTFSIRVAFCVWYWALKVQEGISGRMHELALDCSQHLFRSF